MKKKIIITSVGSLVGQNILDSLEGRRNNLIIIGTNSKAEVANNFRCDKSYLVAEAEDYNRFFADLIDVVEKEQPNLVIPGRDDDVIILARLSKKMPKFKDCFLVGSENFAEAVDDKVKSYQFALKYNLPFAPTVESGLPDAEINAQSLVAEYGYPLIAKPNKGNGSRGIWVVVNDDQLKNINKQTGFAIQPLFGQPKDLTIDLSFGLPFFWEIPETRLFAAQVIINKKSEIEEIFGFISKMVAGKCERMDRCNDPKLIEVVAEFAEAAVKEGWRGPFNIQLKEDPIHGLYCIEMNGRFSGGTSARYHLGFDEVGRTLEDWMGKGVMPECPVPQGVNVVTKILSDFEIKQSNVDVLNAEGIWSLSK